MQFIVVSYSKDGFDVNSIGQKCIAVKLYKKSPRRFSYVYMTANSNALPLLLFDLGFTDFVRSSNVGSRLYPTTLSISFWQFFKISGCRQNRCNKNCICVASATNVANNRSTIVRTNCLSANKMNGLRLKTKKFWSYYDVWIQF